jgi:hypothetical protein
VHHSCITAGLGGITDLPSLDWKISKARTNIASMSVPNFFCASANMAACISEMPVALETTNDSISSTEDVKSCVPGDVDIKESDR